MFCRPAGVRALRRLSRRPRADAKALIVALGVACIGLPIARSLAHDAMLLRLRTAAPLAARLQSGQVHAYALHLEPRACALGTLVNEGVLADVRVAALSGGAPARTYHAEPERRLEYGFCAEAATEYRLEVRARSGSGSYTLTLDAVLTRPPRAAAPAAISVKSPRLRGLRDLLAPNPAAADSFWNELAQAGAPLIEPGSDPESELVTFLWRGDAMTRSVLIDWPATSLDRSAQKLERLAESDVWFTSVVMPAQTRLSYRFVPDPPPDPTPDHAWDDRVAAAVWQADPYNPHSLRADAELDPHERRSIFALAAAPPERWFEGSPSAVGSRQRQFLHSLRLNNHHALDVYLPAGYRARREPGYPLLIFFDGETYLEDIEAPRLLDRLIAAHAIPPLIAVFVRNASGDSRSSELPCNPEFADFVASELLPFVQANYAVDRDPARVGLVGASFGGLASSFIALQHPERFGLVLSQSGSYWWTFDRSSLAFDGSDKPGWLIRRYAASAQLPVRLFLSAGQFESDPAHGGVRQSVREFDAALRAKGYDVQYRENAGGHDPLAWRASLPDGLIALLGARR
jgi:enterochelin esterase-like enzyme